MEFYQRLTGKKTASDDIQFLVVMPQPIDEAKEYLISKNLQVDEVRQMRLSDISVAGTPTLILVDDKGVVLESWVGKLSLQKENEVFSSVFGDRASL